MHLIGIGGTGLSAIARVLLESGYTVSGSDRQMSPLANSLQEAGVRVLIGHKAENIAEAELVIRSSAVPDSNVEVQAAWAAGIPVLKRADFLGHLMEGRVGIGVAGTHGKTTTTAMLAWILTELGQDPTYIIGGVSLNLGSNAHAGRGPVFLIEADEYDRMFLGINPKIAVVTNIEHDHPDCYPTQESFYSAFWEFAGRVPPEGILIACGQDDGARRLIRESAELGKQVRSYGIWEDGDEPAYGPAGSRHYDYLARDLETNKKGGFSFQFEAGTSTSGTENQAGRWEQVQLQVPGRHNVLNASAALAVVDFLGLPLDKAAGALGEFAGVGRRFQVMGEAGGVTVIDDYAHHPTEIRATLSAARKRYPEQRIWAVWQPHTYSRTLGLLDEFAVSFKDCDQVVITDIYAARETAPQGFEPRQISTAIRHSSVRFAANLDEAAAQILREVKPGDVVLVLSAGDADRISAEVLSGLKLSSPEG